MDVIMTMLLLHVRAMAVLLTVNEHIVFDNMVTMDVMMTVLLLHVRVMTVLPTKLDYCFVQHRCPCMHRGRQTPWGEHPTATIPTASTTSDSFC